MKAQRILGILIAVAGIAAAAGVASGQDTEAAQKGSVSEKPSSNPSPQKPRKVWTNDDIGSVRSPADVYTQEKEARAAQVELAVKQATTKNKPAPASAPQQGGPPALTNPKSVTDADSMISWESRDIEAQQATVAQLLKELDEAPAERREALQKSLRERMQVLAETRKELEALQSKKEELRTPPPPANNSAEEKQTSK